MEASWCSSGYGGDQYSPMMQESSMNTLANGNEVEEVKNRFQVFEKRIETLERSLAERVDSKLHTIKMQKKKRFTEGKWAELLADSTTIHGLKEVLTESHCILKYLWFFVFVAAVGFTGYYIHNVFKEYFENKTATKVHLLKQNKYDYPVMLLCPDTWLDMEKAKAVNLSTGQLEYALAYMMNYNVEQAPYRILDVNKSRENFEAWWKQTNFANLLHFFQNISLNSEDFMQDCTNCATNGSLDKAIMNGAVCYNISLEPAEGRVSLGELDFMKVRVPDRSKGLLHKKTYWRLIVNPDLSLGMSDTHFVQVFPGHSNTIRIMPHVFKSLATDKCKAVENARAQNYTQGSCVAQCHVRTQSEICQPLPLLRVDNLSRDISTICNSATALSPTPVVIPPEQALKALDKKCIDDCPSVCEKTVYESSVEAHLLAPYEEVDDHNTTNKEERGNLTVFYFLNQVAHYGGILVHEEVRTYSFETLVSNVGGQLGLWLGASVMSLMQLVMFLMNFCCESKRVRQHLHRSSTASTAKI